MATLTAEEITLIRALTGDTCGPNYDVSDELMQYLHDNVATTEPLCTSSIPFGGTIVWVLEARVAKAAALIDSSGEAGSASSSQKRAALERDLERWREKCGMAGGTITIGSFDMGLDEECDGAEYAPRPYYGYWPWMGY